MRSCRLLVNATSSNTQHKHEEYKFKLIKLSETLIYCHINPTNWKPQIIVPLFQPQISEIKHATTHIIIRRGDKKKREENTNLSSPFRAKTWSEVQPLSSVSKADLKRLLEGLFLNKTTGCSSSMFLSFSAINAKTTTKKKAKRPSKVTPKIGEGNWYLARGKGVIGDAIRCEGIQAGTKDAKVVRDEDGVHHNNW